MTPKRWAIPLGYRVLLVSALMVAGLYAVKVHNDLLFHNLAEFLSIAVAVGMFMVFWNTRRFVDNGFFLYVSTGYLAAAVIDLFHTLAYEGMGVFPHGGTDLETQLWIGARVVQATSLLAATFFVDRQVRRGSLLLASYALSTALLLTITLIGWFPTCYLEGQGFTLFKQISEYAISATLLAALVLLVRKRQAFARAPFLLLVSSILATMVSELAFFFVNDVSNLVGYLAKIIAAYLIYVAMIEVGLQQPYEGLFRILKHNEATLLKRSQELRERVKELDCLYGISALVEKPDATLEEVLQGATELLAAAQQLPEAAAARIVLAGREYRTANYRETPWRMTADLVAHEERCGRVDVFYLEPKPEMGEEPFLKEEHRLLDSVAERLGRIVERFRAEELLQASEYKFRSLVEQSQDGISLTDEQGHVIEWNRAMERITGLTAAQTLGRPIWEVQFELGLTSIATTSPPTRDRPRPVWEVQPEIGRLEGQTEAYRQQLVTAIQQALHTGQSPWLGQVLERKYLRPDGVPRTLEGVMFSIPTASGFMLASISRDVTESRQAEEMLRIKDAAIAAAHDAIAIADLGGHLTYVNASFLRMWGYEHEEEVLGRPAVEFWQEPEAAADIIRRLRQQDNAVGESIARRCDGTSFDAQLTASLVHNAADQPVCMLGVFRDVTKERRTEASLRQAKEEWERTFDAVPDLIAIMDTSHHIVRMNRAMAERLDCTLDECIGRPCYEHVHGTEQPPASCPHALLLQDHQEHATELYEERLGGDFIVTASPLWGPDGKFLGSVHVAHDITERKRAAEALRRSEEAHRRLFETMPQGVVYQDASGAIVSANPAAEVILGLSLDQMQGRTSVDPRWHAMHEDGSDFPGETHPAIVALRTGRPVSGVVMGVYNPAEKQTRWIKVDAVPLFKSGESVPYQVYTTFDDITVRRQFEEILRLNEQRLNSLLELSLKAAELSEEEIVQVAIEEAERLTSSQIAYLHFVHPDERTIQLVAWSEATKQSCTAVPVSHYPLDQAGVWADCVRQRKPVIHNDYQNYADSQGYPEGHVHLVRHTSVPIFDGNQVALILGVGNKATDYDETDVRQLLLIGSQVMRILRRKRTQEELQASLQEKTVLLQEVHHRVKNNLQVISSLLDMQAMTAQDPQTLQVLQDSHNRVRAMAVVHDRLYQSDDLAQIGAREYLESVAGHLYGIYAGRTAPVALRFDIQDIRLDMDRAIPCGLIVNELVSNALKYAFPPGHGPDNEVLIALHRRNGHLLLQVQDNGIGLPAGIEIETATSLGLRLVSILTQQLRGQLEVQRESGTAFRITFPAPDSSEEVPP